MTQAEAMAWVGGLVVGSFLNVCIHRLPAGQSLVRPGSRCPNCRAPIRPWDNIPLVSYCLLRGRCRACGAPISWRYPAVEMLTGLLFLGVVWRFGLGGRAALWGGFLAALVVVTFIDLDHMIVPDRITLPGIAIGLVGAWLWPPPNGWSAAAGVLVGGGFFLAIAFVSPLLLSKGRITVDTDLRIVEVNPIGQRLLGLEPDGLQGKPCDEVFGGGGDLVRICREAAWEGRTHSQEALELPMNVISSVRVILSSMILPKGDNDFGGVTLLLKRERTDLRSVLVVAMMDAFVAGLVATWIWPAPGLWSTVVGGAVGGGLSLLVAFGAPLLSHKGQITVDSDLRVVEVNRTARNLLDLGRDNVQGRPCAEVFGEDSVLVRTCQEAAKAGRTYIEIEEELDLPIKVESFVPIILSSTILRKRDGTLGGVKLVLKREGMGFGDVKLAAMIGAFLGWQGFLVTFMFGTVAGSYVGLRLILTGVNVREQPIPFGPFLALGAAATLFWGEGVLHWYGRLLR